MDRQGSAYGANGHSRDQDLKQRKTLSFPWGSNPDAPEPAYREEVDGVKHFFARDPSKNKRTALEWLAVILPFTEWIRTYRIREYLLWDLLAGISVGFMVVPQGMSYASIAGVPVVFGLYGAFLPVMIYALFGSSKQLGVGPVAVTSMLIGSGMSKLVPGSELISNPSKPEPDQVAIQQTYNIKVIQLAFIVGVMYTAVGFLRLGFLVRFLSHSVITGFTSGAAITIATSQVRYILGYKVPRMDTWQEQLRVLFGGIKGFQWREFVMGMSMIILLIAFRVVGKRVPKLRWVGALGPITACVISIIAVVAGGLDKRGISVVATIPKGLPPPTIKYWGQIENPSGLLGLAVIVMLVDLLESTSIARALARKTGQTLQYNQEIRGLGYANLMGAMFSCYTTTGSFSRSAVNHTSGAKTQFAGFTTSIVVMFVLLFLTPVFEKLPFNTMAAIIIVGVTPLIEFGQAYYLFKTHTRDFLVWLTAFLCVLFLGIELGIAIALALAMLIVIMESAFPHSAVLGRVDQSTVYRSVLQYPEAEQVPGVLVARLDAPLYFANVQHFEDTLEKYERDAATLARKNGINGLRYLVLELTPVSHMDSMGAHMIEELYKDLKERGVQLLLSNPSPQVVRLLRRAGVTDKIGRDWIFVRAHDAVQHAQALLVADKSAHGLPGEELDAPVSSTNLVTSV